MTTSHRPTPSQAAANLPSNWLLSPGVAPLSRVFERNVVGYRRLYWVFIAGFVEPLFYLFGLGIGLGSLIGDIEVDGRMLTYVSFVAPGLIASSAMNGAVFDSTFNFFYKLKYAKTYEAMMTTPLRLVDIILGELTWSIFRATIYSAAFLTIASLLGYIQSWWAILTIPVAILIGFAFSAVGVALTSFMRSWHDFEYIQLVLQPLFLASTTFYPLSVYPGWARPLVQATPLYHAVSLCRNLSIGDLGVHNVGHVTYLLTMAIIGTIVASARVKRLLTI